MTARRSMLQDVMRRARDQNEGLPDRTKAMDGLHRFAVDCFWSGMTKPLNEPILGVWSLFREIFERIDALEGRKGEKRRNP